MNDDNKKLEDTGVNLDELYDGKINQTVIIDPVSKNEVIIKDKKPHFPFFAILAAIIVLLIYFTYNKVDYIGIISKYSNMIFNKRTTTITTTKKKVESTLTCTYTSLYNGINISNNIEIKSEDNVIITNSQDYSYTLTNDTNQLKYNEFITFFDSVYQKLNGITGINVEYNKEAKVFSFELDCFYDVADFTLLGTPYTNEVEYKTNLTMSKSDNINTIRNEYNAMGYICSIK
ncbi:MAG TPA: hypothetical protein PKY25_02730 [Bacilli bacterium]|nr:hypothetical protein [Bacilli bacterium]